MSTELHLRRRGRADPLEMHVAVVAMARELERVQQLTVSLQLSVEDLEERLSLRDAMRSWLPWIALFGFEALLIVAIVFVFEPLRLPH